MYYLISILLGLLPEVLYFTLFLVITKNLKEKRIRLFLLIGIAYFLCLIVQQYEMLFYFLFIFLNYFIIKILYKERVQIIDVFVIGMSYLWIAILSYISLLFMGEELENYYILYFINRIFIFVPFIFKNKFNKIYNKYCELWNRNDIEKRLIKSITLRNMSLILLNGFLMIINLTIINIISFIK